MGWGQTGTHRVSRSSWWGCRPKWGYRLNLDRTDRALAHSRLSFSQRANEAAPVVVSGRPSPRYTLASNSSVRIKLLDSRAHSAAGGVSAPDLGDRLLHDHEMAAASLFPLL